MTRPLSQDNSPRGYNWHARRLFGPDVTYDDLTPDRQEQVAAARSEYMRANGLKGVNARQLVRVRRLREKADAIEAEVRRSEPA